jgi:rhomboid family GlyGly-CTERM serine protease
VITWWLPAAVLDWQPAAAAAEPWRFVTAAWVHWSPLHLAANLAATAVVAALGHAARLPAAAALAWLLAWPLTHAGLWLQPALAHYGGASGVLHAAVAVAACWLIGARNSARNGARMGARQRRVRWIGAAIAAGLVTKLLLEQPWRGPLVHPASWDIAVAPLAHASGVLAGLACVLVVWVGLALRGRLARRRQSAHG